MTDFTTFWQYNELSDLNGFNEDLKPYIRNFFLVDITDYETVNGYSLDLIGKLMGAARRPILIKYNNAVWNQFDWNQDDWNTSALTYADFNPMSDTNYRKVLRMFSFFAVRPRTLNNLLEILGEILPGLVYTYSVIENQVTIEYTLSSVNLEERKILTYIPTPQGTEIDLKVIL